MIKSSPGQCRSVAEHCPVHQNVAIWIPVQGIFPGGGFDPQSDPYISLSSSLSPSFSKVNKNFFFLIIKSSGTQPCQTQRENREVQRSLAAVFRDFVSSLSWLGILHISYLFTPPVHPSPGKLMKACFSVDPSLPVPDFDFSSSAALTTLQFICFFVYLLIVCVLSSFSNYSQQECWSVMRYSIVVGNRCPLNSDNYKQTFYLQECETFKKCVGDEILYHSHVLTFVTLELLGKCVYSNKKSM